MLTLKELEELCAERLEDAKTLLKAHRYEGAYYMCGYVVEIGLKKKICETLGWEGFPNGEGEFKGLNSYKTHDLDMLLHLSGIEKSVKERYLSLWSIVSSWNPEIRYSSKKKNLENCKAMLEASETLIKNL